MNQILQGDCLKLLKGVPDESVDLLCCDPPYSISFMNKCWDKEFLSVETWKECLRVLKPGAFGFIMMTPRQDCLAETIKRLGEAGFITGFSSIYWCHGQGFPKSHNVGKVLDKRERGINLQDYAVFSKEKPPVDVVDGSGFKVVDYSKGVAVPTEERQHGTGGISRGAVGIKQVPAWIPIYEKLYTREVLGRNPNSRENCDKTNTVFESGTVGKTDYLSQGHSALEGSYGGLQLKPALEVILVVMKPMTENTYVNQALKNGHGISWLDDCRIPYAHSPVGETPERVRHYTSKDPFNQIKTKRNSPHFAKHVERDEYTANPQGRFPANLLVSEDALNNGKSNNTAHSRPSNGIFGGDSSNVEFSDEGSFSRFFDLDFWFAEKIKQLPEEAQKTFPFLIVAKASIREKNRGCHKLEDKIQHRVREGGGGLVDDPKWAPKISKNNHPTTKPLKLMSWLITLGSREGELVLDPFAGSGTTCVAAKMLKRNFIGCELNEEYVEIAEARLKAVAKQKTIEDFYE